MNHDSGSRHSGSKLHHILGERFIERTRNELSVMNSQWLAARAGDGVAAEQFLQFAHRIGGAAAMLGFEQVSEPVRSIERILRAGVLSPEDWREIDGHMSQLQNAVSEAEESFTT